ncbi:hypothetical protein PUR34_18955 [Streptomyces sp. JV185]|uniref:DUF3592 domain-containing protein n=1 Tax=Streptomyces sp. JV185 TaxID=858638 RepID=UPI002E79C559|nr:DUF3592 domain-containing protein [Streptomyces sp. JV185]MEE1770164.1 hypothetical protein [Streptomyces sp. JV185]
MSGRRWLHRFGAWTRVTGKIVGGVAVTAVVAFLVVLGYGFVRGGIDGLNDASAAAAHGQSVDGVVVAKDRVAGPQGSRFKRIEVRFTMPSGSSYQFWEGGDADIGDTIRVHYEPGRPGTASTHSVTSNRVGYGMLVLIGLALMVLMPLLLVRLGREGVRDLRRALRSAP